MTCQPTTCACESIYIFSRRPHTKAIVEGRERQRTGRKERGGKKMYEEEGKREF